MAKKDNGQSNLPAVEEKRKLTLADKKIDALNKLFKTNAKTIIATLPDGFNYERMCRAVANAIQTTPRLAECTVASVFLACVRSFSLGLEPNSPLGHAYLVPFRNNKKDGIMEAQFMPGYQGLIDLALRSRDVELIYAREVHEKDKFEVRMGTKQEIVHEPKVFSDRGKIIGAYAVYHRPSGATDFETMSMEDLEKIRQRSKAKDNGPWVTDPGEMRKKTVIKRLSKRMPKSVDDRDRDRLAKAIEADHQVSMGEAQDIETIDVQGLTIPEGDETDVESQAAMNAEKTAELKKKIEDKKNGKKPAPASEELAGGGRASKEIKSEVWKCFMASPACTDGADETRSLMEWSAVWSEIHPDKDEKDATVQDFKDIGLHLEELTRNAE